MLLLFFFLSLSHIVVPKRNSVNTLFSFNINTNNSQKPFTDMAMDIEVNISRDQYASSSTNGSRVSLTHSNMSSTKYAEYI